MNDPIGNPQNFTEVISELRRLLSEGKHIVISGITTGGKVFGGNLEPAHNSSSTITLSSDDGDVTVAVTDIAELTSKVDLLAELAPATS